ncbi:glycosyltransferase, family 1 [Arcobacter venerupis]|uniref:Glycosyltransferase, family 1 n=1 Tax=Arcobacter venerupis TaxID=1054033 RepID=A0AAE7B6X7_9BACT|nr:hypothetical protein [Arcobacter venerupis]QKF66493.1 glycosyltransferase, family 1 [Arcobacter venerupis]RWS48232.1 hypothetical protein CKA56_15095 [Arcobacter venerupis]
MKQKILFIFPVLGQPRDSKRVSMVKEFCFDVKVSAFERDYHKGRLPDCESVSLGKISHGKYLNRILKILKALPLLREEIKKSDIIYASGPDMAYMGLIAALGLKKPLIIEVGDIREIQVKKGFIGNFIRRIDNYLVNKCSLIIVTAPDFLNQYYKKWLNLKIPAIILENKLEKNLNNGISNKIKNFKGKIKIGYFGLIRCPWSFEVLKQFALKNTQNVEVVIAGYPMNPSNIEKAIEGIENMKYIGEYKSPDDLYSLYNQVDIVWASYEYIKDDDWNLKWARTNRFYEACFFQKPIISRHTSNDGNAVEKYNIGITLKNRDINKTINELEKVNHSKLKIWTENIKKLPKEYYIYTNEYDTFKEALLKVGEKCDK